MDTGAIFFGQGGQNPFKGGGPAVSEGLLQGGQGNGRHTGDEPSIRCDGAVADQHGEQPDPLHDEEKGDPETDQNFPEQPDFHDVVTSR